MPLLTSPIDGSPMKQINRFGIELDVCPTSGGIWLDKGELEKIIAMIKEAAEEEAQMYNAPPPPRQPDPRYESRSSHHHDHGHGHDRHHKSSDYYYKKKKKSKLHHVMDIFDF